MRLVPISRGGEVRQRSCVQSRGVLERCKLSVLCGEPCCACCPRPVREMCAVEGLAHGSHSDASGEASAAALQRVKRQRWPEAEVSWWTQVQGGRGLRLVTGGACQLTRSCASAAAHS
eukprot:6186350-Pleurochrysis_carterae.AAC.4